MITSVPTPTSRCRLGVARVDITPPVGIYHRFWGAALHDRAAGVHRPLTATVAVFQPLDDPAAMPFILVALDHCLLRPREMAELLAGCGTATAIPEENWLFAFGHTHSGGHLNRDRANLPGGDLVGPYLDSLPGKIVTAFEQARAAVQRVTLTYGSTICDMARHRDMWDERSQQYVCGFNPAGWTDQTLLVARATTETGQTVATFVNYGCHPTTLAWLNDQISPDYIGALRETVERDTLAPCLFLLSACGDVGPREGFVGDTTVADRNGRQVGYAALSALEGLPPAGADFHYVGPVISGATLGAWEYRGQSAEHETATKEFRGVHLLADVPYLETLPTVAEMETQLAQLIEQEQAALRSGQEKTARDARAMAERKRRELDRIRPLPEGKTYPLPLKVWQFGDAFWVAVEGEAYNVLQRVLRAAFPDRPVIVTTLANGAKNAYMPTREDYSKGLYQVEVAVLAPGCLEAATEALAAAVAEWDGKTAPPV